MVNTLQVTGWLTSLDLRQVPLVVSSDLSHRTASSHALFDVLVLDKGRGKTMNDLVGRDRELPANKAKLNKAKLHTETYMRTYTEEHPPPISPSHIGVPVSAPRQSTS